MAQRRPKKSKRALQYKRAILAPSPMRVGRKPWEKGLRVRIPLAVLGQERVVQEAAVSLVKDLLPEELPIHQSRALTGFAKEDLDKLSPSARLKVEASLAKQTSTYQAGSDEKPSCVSSLPNKENSSTNIFPKVPEFPLFESFCDGDSLGNFLKKGDDFDNPILENN